ncbi:aldose reductase-like [Agrilus planipennis]|uniref:Aldose reductase-like n=1 Tax=Agrilus planipennis TaxID=224129 RepID=A0A1W4XC91_AGRPL|nr:aldose reductase-like [Agrilus planipennis]
MKPFSFMPKFFQRYQMNSTCKATTNIPMLTFNNGKKFPLFGLGTWKSKPGDVTCAVMYAIDIGYRHIDCAYIYGNEKEVGRGISMKICDNTVQRNELYITSKLWNTFHEPCLVKSAIEMTLSNLRIDYLDLYLIHWPFGWKAGDDLFPRTNDGKSIFSKVDYVDTWRAMEEVCKNGLALSIGVSNFNERQLNRVLQIAKIPPVTNQIELHPYLTQKNLTEYCKSRFVMLTAYSPLGSPDRPTYSADEPELLKDKRLEELAKKYNKTPAQVLLRYQVQQRRITIPKSVTPARIRENMEIFDFEISKSDMGYIDTFNKNLRFCASLESVGHEHYPFTVSPCP